MRDCLLDLFNAEARDAEFFGQGCGLLHPQMNRFFDMINMIVFGAGSGFSLTEAQRTRRLLWVGAPGKQCTNALINLRASPRW